jgi:hypothetical protein
VIAMIFADSESDCILSRRGDYPACNSKTRLITKGNEIKRPGMKINENKKIDNILDSIFNFYSYFHERE